MKQLHIVTILSASLLLGCASTESQDPSVWHQEGKTEADIAKDLAACRLHANTSTIGFQGRSLGQYAFTKSVQENSAINDCMMSKGYTLKKKK